MKLLFGPLTWLFSWIQPSKVEARVVFVSPYFQIQMRSSRWEQWQVLRDNNPSSILNLTEDVTEHYRREGIKSAVLTRTYYPIRCFQSMQSAEDHISQIMGVSDGD